MLSLVSSSGLLLLTWILLARMEEEFGLPFSPTAVHSYNILWQAASTLLIPLIKKLPQKWWENWLP